MEIAGYIAALFIGIALGLIGGGGSVLTVPVLYYLFGLDAVTSTAWSLFIVGITSAAGSVSYFRRKEVDIKTAVIFGIPSVAAVFATRAWILPAIPDIIFTLGGVTITKDLFLLILFAILMLVSSFSMIRKNRIPAGTGTHHGSMRIPFILGEGIAVGVITGLVGAGGGFVIVPALVLVSRLPMKTAIGTSLVIIAAKSLIGFTAEAGQIGSHWFMLLCISACAVAGVFAGAAISKRVDGNKLQPVFGWFILGMGLFILLREIIRLKGSM